MLSYLTNLSAVPLATKGNKCEFYRNKPEGKKWIVNFFLWVLGSSKHYKKGDKTTNPGVGEDREKSEEKEAWKSSEAESGS